MQDEFTQKPKSKVIVQDKIIKKVEVAKLTHNVIKSKTVKKSDYILVKIDEIEAKNNNFAPYDTINVIEGSLYQKDMKEGEVLSGNDILNPGDAGYLQLSLGDHLMPYHYKAGNQEIIESLPIRIGDRVSFVATSSSVDNIKESGYSNIHSISSRVVVRDAKVVQILKSVESKDSERNVPSSLLIALSLEEILKLEMAQKLGDVTLVPSKLSVQLTVIKSSDVLDGVSGVRELRISGGMQ
ncbi:pilus assembly protein CpaB [Photobacterium proteolyticum]|nr:pilus assembly protein CpaB [Photobacterium proteolyticum]